MQPPNLFISLWPQLQGPARCFCPHLDVSATRTHVSTMQQQTTNNTHDRTLLHSSENENNIAS